MTIDIKTIPHNEQRYPTVGDWWFEGDMLHIRVSNMNNAHYEWFVAEHEINEALLCRISGISEKDVSDFDMKFEELRKNHPDLIGDHEPGDMSSAPYHTPHAIATEIELQTVDAFNEDWDAYNNTVNSL